MTLLNWVNDPIGFGNDQPFFKGQKEIPGRGGSSEAHGTSRPPRVMGRVGPQNPAELPLGDDMLKVNIILSARALCSGPRKGESVATGRRF